MLIICLLLPGYYLLGVNHIFLFHPPWRTFAPPLLSPALAKCAPAKTFFCGAAFATLSAIRTAFKGFATPPMLADLAAPEGFEHEVIVGLRGDV